MLGPLLVVRVVHDIPAPEFVMGVAASNPPAAPFSKLIKTTTRQVVVMVAVTVVAAEAVLTSEPCVIVLLRATAFSPLHPVNYNAKMPEAFHVIPMLPPFGVTGKPVTDVSI